MTQEQSVGEDVTPILSRALIGERCKIDATTDDPTASVTPSENPDLFASFWNISFDTEIPVALDGYAVLTWHIGGGNVSGRYNRFGANTINAHRSLLTFMPSEKPAYWRSEGDVEHMHFYLPTSDIAAHAGALLGDERAVDDLEVSVRRVPMLLRDIQRFTGIAKSGPMTALELSGWRQMIAGQVVRAFSSTQTRDIAAQNVIPLSDDDTARVIEFMHAHIDESVTQDALASLVDLSPFHFNRAFKLSVGQAPHQHFLSLRLEKAKELLKTTKVTLADVAYACGFSSQQHMTSTFSKHVGVSPGRFRKHVDNETHEHALSAGGALR